MSESDDAVLTRLVNALAASRYERGRPASIVPIPTHSYAVSGHWLPEPDKPRPKPRPAEPWYPPPWTPPPLLMTTHDPSFGGPV